ncbi:MAG: winged helix-turn-helix domain-containing protein [Candidatus Marsarchaeota archaeon]|nr:winged helix-turn-helix domain-containing protein [Candidatus Marsarchaeota archaeon]
MSKTWHMKKRVLKILSKRPRTPGEISKLLGLSPSTVSVHIAELERIGAIERVENGYAKRWKYYRIKPGFNIEKAICVKEVNMIPLILMGIAIAAFIGVGAFIGLIPHGGQATTILTIQLTDPPNVPNGTQALLVSYSSLQVRMRDSPGWITDNTTGIVNLMSLTNVSEVVGKLKVPMNASVGTIRFNITSARILVNGMTYNVDVPNHQLSANVIGVGAAGNMSVLMDMRTKIASTANATYMLVTSLKAVAVNNIDANEQVGSTNQLNVSVENELNQIGGDNNTASSGP